MEAFHGVTLPFGGVKGASISLMMEVFSAVLTGAAFGGKVSSLYNDFTKKQNVGHFIFVMRTDLFMSTEEFKSRMDQLVEAIKSQRIANGFQEILMTGEVESRNEMDRKLHGIPIQFDVMKALSDEAAHFSLPFPYEL